MNTIRKPIVNPDPTKELWYWSEVHSTVISTMNDLEVYKAILHCYIQVHNNSKFFYVAQQKANASKSPVVIETNQRKMREHYENAQHFYDKLLALKQHCKDMGFKYPVDFENAKSILNATKARYISNKKQRQD